MKRINTANRAIDLFGAGKDGFKAAVPGVSDATYFSALWANHVQEALARLREAAGIAVPADNDFDWFPTAVQKLIEARAGDYSLDTGVANAYVVAMNPVVAAYTKGLEVKFKVAAANTLASTLDAGAGPVALVRNDGVALVAGDLPLNALISATCDGPAGPFIINSIVVSQALTQTAADVRYELKRSDAGQVAFFARSTAPVGWTKANGALVSRTTFAALFASIGTAFGVGDGATTFGLPDLRGEFLRALDDGRGVDAARTLGSAQAGANAPHGHTASSGAAGAHSHGYTARDAASASSQNASGGSNLDFRAATTSVDGDHLHPITVDSSGTEARPRNIALLACIKF